MTINVVKDSSGKTIATFETVTGQGASITPQLATGFKLDKLEVATGYEKTPANIYR